MEALEQLYSLYEEYEQKVRKVHGKASPFAGAFNMGDDPRRHACHEQFYDDVGEWVEAFLKTDPSPNALSEAAHWLLETAAAHRGEDTYWYLYAIHGHVKALIPRLTEQDCRRLREMYDKCYPPLDRLPAQQEVYKLLKKYAGTEAKAGRGFRVPFFKR